MSITTIDRPKHASSGAPPERDASPAEMRALANPLRLRILRVTLHRPLTNKQIAERLGRDPGTVLHHVRALVATGFLAPQEVRVGKRGSLERPYRATGKSWRVRMLPNRGYMVSVLDAVRDEVIESGEQAALAVVRLGVRLSEADLTELRRRTAELGDDFVTRDDPNGEPVGILALAYRRKP
jgi:DNA-binding transcriptional ArsR family regulator